VSAIAPVGSAESPRGILRRGRAGLPSRPEAVATPVTTPPAGARFSSPRSCLTGSSLVCADFRPQSIFPRHRGEAFAIVRPTSPPSPILEVLCGFAKGAVGHARRSIDWHCTPPGHPFSDRNFQPKNTSRRKVPGAKSSHDSGHGVRRAHHSTSTTVNPRARARNSITKPPPQRVGLPVRIGSSLSFVANSAKADQQARCIFAQPAEKAPQRARLFVRHQGRRR
jgi:hypothetical protein